MSKTLDTLVEDVYGLFDKATVIPDKLAEDFAKQVTELIKSRLSEDRVHTEPMLRLSKIGLPDRKIWYEINSHKQDNLDGQTRIKFLFGDIVEALLLLLIKVAGHTVTEEQKEVEIDGVLGHQDCKIDSVPVDIKTASSYGMRKFRDRSILNGNDPFGYLAQISSYAKAQNEDRGALLVLNKENAELLLLKVDNIDMINPKERVKHLKNVILSKTPPERCYPDEAVGASGNRALSTDCNYCDHKFECWADANGGAGLRGFKYSKGVEWLTQVSKTPNVEEVKKDV